MHSAVLAKSAFYDAKKRLGKGKSSLKNALTKVNDIFIKWRHRCEEAPGDSRFGRTFFEKSRADALDRALTRLCEPLEIWLDEHRDPDETHEALLQLYFDIRAWLRVADTFDDHFVLQISAHGNEVRAAMLCLDPSDFLAADFAKGRAAVLFSATLAPAGYYRDLCGLADARAVALRSPFDTEHLGLWCARHVSTRYKDRADSIAKVTDLLAVMSGARVGHYLAFFPSYSYLQQVWEDFTARYPDQPTLCQESAMDEGKRAEFLARFQKSDGRPLLGFAVLGGVFAGRSVCDPAWLPHPVVLMGRCISALEKHLRTALPKTPRGELAGGAAVAAVLPLGTLAVTGLACWAAARLHPALGLALQMLWCGQALAAKGLAQESRNVYKELAKGDLPAARRAVARIVGRDTQNLTAAGVTRAAVETVAENASDGVIAPLLYMLLGGAPLALTYKAINTMDSMLGYKNEKYLYFGRCAAKLDDAANWLPSRLAALLWVAAAALTGNSARGAWRIWRRDRRRHASPNSAQTESACAGALGVQLAGPAYYFGEYYDKPTIGDPLREIEPRDVLRANRMMYAESLLALVLGLAVRLMLVL